MKQVFNSSLNSSCSSKSPPCSSFSPQPPLSSPDAGVKALPTTATASALITMNVSTAGVAGLSKAVLVIIHVPMTQTMSGAATFTPIARVRMGVRLVRTRDPVRAVILVSLRFKMHRMFVNLIDPVCPGGNEFFCCQY